MQKLIFAVIFLVAFEVKLLAKSWQCTYPAAVYCHSSDETYCGFAKKGLASRYSYEGAGNARVSVEADFGADRWIEVNQAAIHAYKVGNTYKFLIFDPVGGGRLVSIFADNRVVVTAIESDQSVFVRRGTCVERRG